MKIFVALVASLILLSAPVNAAEYTYAPDGCEFNVTFPEAPADSKACDSANPKDCHLVSTYTKIYDVSTGMRINVTCAPAQPGMMEKYSGEVMQYTLGAMAREHIDRDQAQTAFEDLGTAKQAVLMATKKQEDGSESVYMSELWIGKKSVLTLEGEMTGPPNQDADTLFARIMKSVRPQAEAKTPEKAAQKPESAVPDKAEAPDKVGEKAPKP
ncbi:MAG: hypothetical protein JWO78_929 [Micavibrio sp.]|nr:hypothetical protein [Micavibrio sp.]